MAVGGEGSASSNETWNKSRDDKVAHLATGYDAGALSVIGCSSLWETLQFTSEVKFYFQGERHSNELSLCEIPPKFSPV